MAFEDNLGHDSSQPIGQDYTVSATGLISRTLSLLTSKFVHYIIIVGIAGAASVILSYVLLYALFGLIGVITADPFGYFISNFLLAPSLDIVLLGVLVGYAIFAFVLTAILGGAAIKFTLDEYGGTTGDVGTSFSRSFRRFPTIIMVQLLTSAMVAIAITPATILSARAMAMIDITDITDPFDLIFPQGFMEMLLLSFVLLAVGGLFLAYFQTRLAPTLAIVLDTDLSAIDSFKKSWELTSGNFMHVFGSTILLGIVASVLTLIVSIFTTMTLLPTATTLVIDAVITTLLFGALTYIFTVVLYRDLSSRKGTSTSTVSSSLDELRV